MAARFAPARLVSAALPPAALQLGEAYVACVAPRHVGALMKLLGDELPLGALAHLKRVRKPPPPSDDSTVSVLLCLKAALEAAHAGSAGQPQPEQQHTHVPQPGHAHQPDHARLPPLLPPRTAALLAQCAARIELAPVPLAPADSREAWASWHKIWPMPYRIPTATLQPSELHPGAGEQAYFEAHMGRALALSCGAAGRNVAVIVDPRSGEVLAEQVDESVDHPLDHAVMQAIEAVAARDRVLWPHNGFAHLGRHPDKPEVDAFTAIAPPPHLHPHHAQLVAAAATAAAAADAGPGTASPLQAGEDGSGTRPQKKAKPGAAEWQGQAPPLQDAAQWCKLPADQLPPANGADHAPDWAADAVPQQQQQQQQQADANGSAAGGAGGHIDWRLKPYLCTGYDCFLVTEPCSMCAMALVHARLARVVFCRPNPTHGALGGAYMLQAHRSLNHHYKVYHLQEAGKQQAANGLPDGRGC